MVVISNGWVVIEEEIWCSNENHKRPVNKLNIIECLSPWKLIICENKTWNKTEIIKELIEYAILIILFITYIHYQTQNL